MHPISIKRDLIWNLIGQFTYLFSLWLITILTTRLMGYDKQGILSLALVAANICTAIANYFLRLEYASDLKSRFTDSDYVITRFILTGISAIVCLLYCFALRYSFEIIGCIMLFYVYKVFEMLSDIYMGVEQKYGKLYVGGIVLTAKGVVSVGVFAVLAYATKNFVISLLGLGLCGAAFFVIDVVATRKLTPYKIDLSSYRAKTLGSLLCVCLPLFLLIFLSNTLPSVPRIVFEKIYSHEELGYYASIANIAVLIQTAASAGTIPLVPKISRLYNNGDTNGFLKYVGGFLGVFALLGLIAIVAVVFLGEWALTLIYGESVQPYAYVFVWVIVATILTAMLAIATQILGAMSHRFLAVIPVLIGTGVSAGLSFPFCTYFYMNGISFSLISGAGAALVISLVFIWLKRHHEPKAIIEEPKSVAD